MTPYFDTQVDATIERLEIGALAAMLLDDSLPLTITQNDLRARLRRTAGVVTSPTTAGTVLRSWSSMGYLRRDGDAYRATAKLRALRDDVRDAEAAADQKLREFLGRVAEAHGISDPGQLRYWLYVALAVVADAAYADGVLIVHQVDEVLTAPHSWLSRLDTGRVLASINCPNEKFIEALRVAFDELATGENVVMRLLLADAVVARGCHNMIRELRADRRRLLWEEMGALHLVFETSYLVELVLTPARLDEGIGCIKDAKRAGVSMEITEPTTREYRKAISKARKQIIARFDRFLEEGRPDHAAAARSWNVDDSWPLRAAVHHGVLVRYDIARRERGAAEAAQLVYEFLAQLRELPVQLKRLGVAIDRPAVSASPEFDERVETAIRRHTDRRGDPLRHDVAVMSHAQWARERGVPFTFIASTDEMMNPIFREAIADGGRSVLANADIGVPPLHLAGLVNALTEDGHRFASTQALRATWRFGEWALLDSGLGSEQPTDKDRLRSLVVADDGELAEGERHPLCERVHEVITASIDATMRRLQRLDDALSTADPLTPRRPEPEPEATDVDDEPVAAPSRIKTWAMAFFLTVVASSVGLVAGRPDRVAEITMDSTVMVRVAIGVLGATAAILQVMQHRYGESRSRTALIGVILTILAVLGALTVVS